jgi:hypothetical protein
LILHKFSIITIGPASFQEKIAEILMLHLLRQKLGILSKQRGQWHTEMERLSAVEVSWSHRKGMWWSPSYSRWWAERQAWHARRKRFWGFVGWFGEPPSNWLRTEKSAFPGSIPASNT